MADREVKKVAETLIEIDQKTVNQKDPLQIKKEAMPPEMTEESRSILDMAKRATLREIAWQKMFIYTMKRKLMKMLT